VKLSRAVFVSLIVVLFVTPISMAQASTEDEQNNIEVYEAAAPGVVNITTISVERDFFFNVVPRQGAGSGAIIDNEGYILTNYHVIQDSRRLEVTLADGSKWQGKLVGTDPDNDLAVIKIDAPSHKLTVIPMGDSDHLLVGQKILAIGNPFGLGQTVTSGIISAMERSGLGIEGYENFLQTDASINPGNSGGALVNLRGELIGINTAIFSKSGGNIGIGFAIPINMAYDIMQQLIEHGEVKRGRLGAQAQDLTPQLAQAFNIPFRRGAVVAHVDKNSPADLAGLKPGDVIIELNGKAVKNADMLRNAMGLLRIGQSVQMKVLRDKKVLSLTATVAKPDMTEETVAGKKLHRHLAGTVLQNIQPDSKLYGRIEGVIISSVEPGTPAATTGLRRGDIITSANRKNIKNIKELQTAINSNKSLLINIRRGNGSLFLFLQ